MFAANPEAFVQKKPPEVFLKISQNSQENTCARVSTKFLTTSIFIEHLRWLLLPISEVNSRVD